MRDAAAGHDRKSRFSVPANCGSMYMREKGMASGRPQKRGKSRNRFISAGLTDGMPSAGRTGLPDREAGPAPSAFSSRTENASLYPRSGMPGGHGSGRKNGRLCGPFFIPPALRERGFFCTQKRKIFCAAFFFSDLCLRHAAGGKAVTGRHCF